MNCADAGKCPRCLSSCRQRGSSTVRSELQQIKMHVYEDGKIDESEIRMLRGVVDAETPEEDEVRLLLDLNNVLSGSEMEPGFAELLVDATVKFVLDDAGVLSDEKLDWLTTNISKDGKTDANEMLILRAIQEKASQVPDGFASLLG